jgi:hypothetical protein
MQPYRPDRMVRVLTKLVSIAYFGGMIAGTLLLIAMPALKLFANDGNTDLSWGLEVPVTIQDSAATVATSWGPARLELDEAKADLELPIVRLPWWFVGVLWMHAAVAFGLMLAALHHLRRIFQRVRDGVPFDSQNALRLRWLGTLLLALALFNGVAETITTLAVQRGLTSSIIGVRTGVHVDGWLVFSALVLMALAEIFRRGAELEHEQSLVV